MTEASDDTPVGRKNLLTLTLLIIIALMGAYAVFGNRGVLRILQAQEHKQELEQQLADLKSRQQELEERIERLQHDKDYWEYLARTRLGMVRDGERIYHIPDLEKDSQKANKQ